MAKLARSWWFLGSMEGDSSMNFRDVMFRIERKPYCKTNIHRVGKDWPFEKDRIICQLPFFRG